MSIRTTGMPDHRADSLNQRAWPSDPDADRLASLAALTMSRQQPGLVLPSLAGIPSSHSYTQGGNSAVKLARSLTTLGLGSREIWERNNGNLSTFIRNSLDVWLNSLGVAELADHVSFDFAIVDALDTSSGTEAPEGRLLILLETSDGCGFITIGKQIDELEMEKEGLGQAFYAVLTDTLYSWMRTYDIHDAEQYVDRWRESIEMDMESDDDDSTEKENFDKYCKENGISLPDIEGAMPTCLRGGRPNHKAGSQKRSISLLQQHRQGPYREWIEPVLAMATIRQTRWKPEGVVREIVQDDFDDGPLPSWIVAFSDHDPITQAFDEERQNVYEVSHSPLWLDSFDPGDTSDVRRVLTYVQRFVEVNRNVVQLQKAIEKGSSHASTNRPELDDELRAP
jgi:hypothetical protein